MRAYAHGLEICAVERTPSYENSAHLPWRFACTYDTAHGHHHTGKHFAQQGAALIGVATLVAAKRLCSRVGSVYVDWYTSGYKTSNLAATKRRDCPSFYAQYGPLRRLKCTLSAAIHCSTVCTDHGLNSCLTKGKPLIGSWNQEKLSGIENRIFVCAGERYHELVRQVYRKVRTEHNQLQLTNVIRS
eukprot:IDg9495t1